MKNNLQKAAFEKTPLSEILEENASIQWISNNGRILLIGLFAAVLLLFTAYRFSSFAIVKSELKFINAENEYQRFISEKNSAQSENALKELSLTMQAYPELYAKYDGQIAEKLLTSKTPLESLPFATRAIDRVKSENSPFYTNYSENTLLMAEQKYEDALKKSLNLNETMIKEEAENSLLFAFNLLRIGILQQQLGKKEEEAATWQEWNRRANLTKSQEPFKTLMNQFNAGHLFLSNYIESRK